MRLSANLPLLVLIAGLGACVSVEVRPGMRPDIEPGEGLLALGFEADTLVYAHISPDGMGEAFTVSPVYLGKNFRTYHLQPGVYCLTQLRCSVTDYTLPHKACVKVEAGATTVTGFREQKERLVEPPPLAEVVAQFKQVHPELSTRFPRILEQPLPALNEADYISME